MSRVHATLLLESVFRFIFAYRAFSTLFPVRTEMIQDAQLNRASSLPFRRRNEIDKLTVIAAVDAEIFAVDGEYLRSGV